MITILIADDEPNIRKSLSRLLSLEGYRVLEASHGREALEIIGRLSVDLLLLDVLMPEKDGLTTLKLLRETHTDLPVVMMSGNATIESAVQATRMGAHDFLEKPLSTDKLLITLSNALRFARLHREHAELVEQAEDPMVGSGPRMKQIFAMIEKIAPSQGRVLITGANGTGKELVARAIHRRSSRAEGPFVKLNCAAIPAELIESELFGHEKGAFTGALRLRKGKFEEADGGTLFLDEIGEIDLNTQVKLLRAIGERTIERLGSNKPIKVDVRVVAATNKDLSEMVREGTFRDDLFFRLNVVSIAMPPLRARKEDLVLLVDAFLKEFTEENGKAPMELTAEAMQLLLDYEWPGNVRELRTVVEHGVVMSNTSKIGVRHLPLFLRDDSLRDLRGGGTGARARIAPSALPAEPEDLNLARMEQRLIRLALERTGGHRTEAAKLLGISRRTTQRKLKEMGLVEE